MADKVVFKNCEWTHEDRSMRGLRGVYNRFCQWLGLPIAERHVYTCSFPPVTIPPGESVTFMFPVPDIEDKP